jgi:hypothetical protein
MPDRMIMETLPIDKKMNNHIKSMIIRTSYPKKETEFRVLVPGNAAMLVFIW